MAMLLQQEKGAASTDGSDEDSGSQSGDEDEMSIAAATPPRSKPVRTPQGVKCARCDSTKHGILKWLFWLVL